MDRAPQFIGESTPFLDAMERASRAASTNRPVLVVGERGTGKELVAERLHRLSPRWGEPLVTLNCATLPETLIEAELFGHEAGAFTGAVRARAGRFEEADKGTLFLDELATLSMAAQERLLRAIEYGEVARIGASRPMRVDVR
ncbi:MAG: sigma 54-interacting transcriptional regulator, partial [Sphingomonadales bacterium]|nr:sigma 54-interacting transcriptional regulator [Sphingomonadales bacterium]